jgi:enterochelin esterase-like enzyme
VTRARLAGCLAAVGMLAWAAWGIHGSLVYGSNYYDYRGFAAPHEPGGVPKGRLVDAGFFSRALGQRRSYLIYLPHGYAAAAARGKRFPVYYFLHGSPGKPIGSYKIARIGVEYDVLLHEHRIKPFLMVMPDGRNGTFRSDTEWANTRSAGRYGSFVTDVVHAVDSRWATIHGRRNRMIAGYSEGGYAALNLSLHDLGTFGSLESWSGYVHQDAKAPPFAGEPASVVAANEPNLYLPHVARQVRRLGLRAYIYTESHDKERGQVIDYSHQLAGAGGDVSLSVFPGHHNWRTWRAHTPTMLLWASRTFGR